MDIRNIAIIAHVDHGNTTLVDGMLKQTHTFRDNEAEMEQTTIMDSNALEREKGITILAKNTSVAYKGTKINIIDTPGHADFSGEVERTINMSDGALLIVDAAEGPLPQTQFVLEQALKRDLPIIVIINKIDRKDARPLEVIHEVEELFLRLATKDHHLQYALLFGVGRTEKVWNTYPDDIEGPGDLCPLFETILAIIPKPSGNPEKPFKMLVSSLDFDPYKGVFCIGKITDGSVKPGQPVVVLDENTVKGSGKIEHVYTYEGLKQVDVPLGQTGDIVAISGIPDIAIGQTISDPSDPRGYPMIHVEDPTLKILISANTSPLAGKEG